MRRPRLPARPAVRLLALALVATLSACGGSSGDPTRQSLLRTIGLRQPPPDEFLVVERKPLEMPPSLRELPPPTPGGVNRVDPQPLEDASALLSNAGRPVASAAPSPGETAFLATTGADAADPAVRDTLVAEDAALKEGGQRYGLRTFFGRQTFDPYRTEVLDPQAETQRLREQGVATPAAPPPPPPPDGFKLF